MILLDGKDITKYLKSQPVIPQERKFIGSDFIVTDLDLDVDNITGQFFVTNPSGIFYPTGYWNKTIEIIDDETNETIWEGVIRDVPTDDYGNATIECYSSLILATESPLEYDVAGLTAPEHIFAILSSVLPQSKFNMASFNDAINYHRDLGLLVDVEYLIGDNVSRLAASQALAELALCNLFTINNSIYLKQLRPYTNQNPKVLSNDDIIAGSVSDNYVPDNIINAYSIKSLGVDPVENQNDDSIARYAQTLSFDRDYSTAPLTLPDNPNAIRRLYDNLLIMFSNAKNRRIFKGFQTLNDLSIVDLIKVLDSGRGINAVYEIFRIQNNEAEDNIEFLCYNYQEIL